MLESVNAAVELAFSIEVTPVALSKLNVAVAVADNVMLSIAVNVGENAVSYTHLTLPTKRIV